MATISGTINSGITLSTSGSYASPLTITMSGYVDNPSAGDAIYGPDTLAWTVANYGRVASTGAAGRYGINLRAGGFVSNSGMITARTAGINIAGTLGTVINTATIAAGTGVVLSAGGTVDNSGTIAATGAQGVGIKLAGGGTISNAGRITGNQATIELVSGGAITNQSGGTIAGLGVVLDNGGTVVNQSGGIINADLLGIYAKGAAATVTNAGSIDGYTLNTGAMFRAGGRCSIRPGARSEASRPPPMSKAPPAP